MVTLTSDGIKSVIRALLTDGLNHRSAVFEDINRHFLQYAIEFFADIARAKLKGEEINEPDWYLAALSNRSIAKDDIATRAGLPMKMIENVRESTRREVVLEEGLSNYQHLRSTMEELLALSAPDIILTVKVGGVGIDLNVTESLIVINALAVKRDQIRGGMWSAVGNAVERPLMRTLCELHHVSPRHWRDAEPNEFPHQIDFVLMHEGHQHLVEVKLSGKGNPESAKAAHAHSASLLVGDRVSAQAKQSMERNRVEWVELAAPSGYMRFARALKAFHIPHEPCLDLTRLDDILDRIVPLP